VGTSEFWSGINQIIDLENTHNLNQWESLRFKKNSLNISQWSTTEKIKWWYFWHSANFHWISATLTDWNLEKSGRITIMKMWQLWHLALKTLQEQEYFVEQIFYFSCWNIIAKKENSLILVGKLGEDNSKRHDFHSSLEWISGSRHVGTRFLKFLSVCSHSRVNCVHLDLSREFWQQWNNRLVLQLRSPVPITSAQTSWFIRYLDEGLVP